MCRETGNLFFHICCEIYNKRRGHLNAGLKNLIKRYKFAYYNMPIRLFIMDNFNLGIYKQAIFILMDK